MQTFLDKLLAPPAPLGAPALLLAFQPKYAGNL